MFIQCCWNIHFCSCFWMFVASLIFLVVPKTALTFLTCKVWRFNPGCLCFLLWQQHPHLDRGSRTGIKKVVGVPAKPDFKDSIALCISLSLCSYSIVQAQRFNAQEAAEWISSRYQASYWWWTSQGGPSQSLQAVMEEYEKQKQWLPQLLNHLKPCRLQDAAATGNGAQRHNDIMSKKQSKSRA